MSSKTDVINGKVQICEDMSCVIYNETGFAVADVIKNTIGLLKKDVKNKLFLTEEEQSFTGKKWWMLDLTEPVTIKEKCD